MRDDGSSEVRRPVVTALVVNFNSGDLLKRCIRRLADQNEPFYEVIVIDNGSTDGSIEIGAPSIPIRLLRLNRNAGFAAANNFGLTECKSDFVALINPDAFLDSFWLNHMLEGASRHPDCASFSSRLIDATAPDRLDGAGDCYHVSGRYWRGGRGQPLEFDSDRERAVFAACAAAALYRRDLVIAVGGFDEDYFCYGEDVDLGFRLRLAGYRCLHVPAAIAHHVGSATTGGQRGDFAAYYGHRNMVWTFVKDMPGFMFWCLLPLHLLLNVVAIAMLTWRGQAVTVLRAKRDAITGLHAIWEKRRSVQRQRIATPTTIWRALDKRLFPE